MDKVENIQVLLQLKPLDKTKINEYCKLLSDEDLKNYPVTHFFDET